MKLITSLDKREEIELESTITCPNCGFKKEELMPTDACVFFYECEKCKATLNPKQGDCCVYCSYGSRKCPSIQAGIDCSGCINMAASLHNAEKMNYKIAFVLAILTIVLCFLEGFGSAFFGLKADNLTLLGFGIDSFIEVVSGFGIVHMILRIQRNPESNRDKFEKTALKITGFSFFILASGLVLTSIYSLYKEHAPESGLSGIIISLVSILLMLFLIYGKTRIGKALKSKAILGDAECTKVCVYMSLVLLVSSGVYQLTKLSFIDSIGTLGIAYLSFKEGKECFEKASSDKNCKCC